MAGSGTINIGGLIDDLPSGSKTIDLSFTISAAVDSSTTVNLASGDNTFTPPSGVNAMIVIPPSGNTTAIKVKGAAGDTGVRLNNDQPSLIGLGASSNVILNAAAIVNSVTVVFV